MKKKSVPPSFYFIKCGVPLLGLLFLSTCVSCISYKGVELTYLDSYDIPPNSNIGGATFGGISGIDYNEKAESYFLVSDDRSEHDMARAYVAKIDLGQQDIDTVAIETILYLSGSEGGTFELEGSDMESIRYNPAMNLLAIGNEGGKKGVAAIGFFDLNGKIQNNVKLPPDYEKYLRENKSFESLSFSKDYKYLFYSTEAPLINDGAEATSKARGLLRINDLNIESGEKENEYLYKLEKVPQKAEVKPPWQGPGSDNGLAELIALPNGQFLTLERSGAYQRDGSFAYKCKVFQVFPKRVKVGEELRAIYTKKKMVFDFATVPNGDFNIEGMTLGPTLNGKRSLLFVSDNNFKENIPTRFYLFQINNIN